LQIRLLAEADVQDACTRRLNSDVQGDDVGNRLTGWKRYNAGDSVKDSLHIGNLKGCIGGDGLGLESNAHKLSLLIPLGSPLFMSDRCLHELGIDLEGVQNKCRVKIYHLGGAAAHDAERKPVFESILHPQIKHRPLS
jgi:hypothetical protein